MGVSKFPLTGGFSHNRGSSKIRCLKKKKRKKKSPLCCSGVRGTVAVTPRPLPPHPVAVWGQGHTRRGEGWNPQVPSAFSSQPALAWGHRGGGDRWVTQPRPCSWGAGRGSGGLLRGRGAVLGGGCPGAPQPRGLTPAPLSLRQGIAVELLRGPASAGADLDVGRARHDRPALHPLPGPLRRLQLRPGLRHHHRARLPAPRGGAAPEGRRGPALAAGP